MAMAARDEHGTVLDLVLRPHRNMEAARTFLTRLLGECDVSEVIQTDRLWSLAEELAGDRLVAIKPSGCAGVRGPADASLPLSPCRQGDASLQLLGGQQLIGKQFAAPGQCGQTAALCFGVPAFREKDFQRVVLGDLHRTSGDHASAG